MATGGAENFSFHSPHHRVLNLPNGTGNFLFASYYGQKSKMPNAGAKKFPSHLLLQSEQGKMAGTEPGNKKAVNLFQTYCFRWPPVAAGIQFLKVWADWLDNLGFAGRLSSKFLL